MSNDPGQLSKRNSKVPFALWVVTLLFMFPAFSYAAETCSSRGRPATLGENSNPGSRSCRAQMGKNRAFQQDDSIDQVVRSHCKGCTPGFVREVAKRSHHCQDGVKIYRTILKDQLNFTATEQLTEEVCKERRRNFLKNSPDRVYRTPILPVQPTETRT